jgi:hypothetical protein
MEVLMRTLLSLLALFALLLSSGCQGVSVDTGAPPEITSNPDVSLTSTPDRMDEEMKKTPERVPPTEIATSITGEVPQDLLDSLLKDLAERTGASLQNISVLQAQAMIWNDGSLGCAKPGEFYTQEQVPGYWVILEIEGKKYDYRAARTGYFLLCEGAPRPTPPGTPSS